MDRLFYPASKVLGLLTIPSNLLALGIVTAFLLICWRRARAGVVLLAVCTLLVLVLGFGPIGGLEVQTLERRFPAWRQCGRAPAGVVVLDGAVQRLPWAVALARRFPSARIIYSGRTSLIAAADPKKIRPQDLLVAGGIASGRLELETRSRDTYENAVFSRRLADPKPGQIWLLVTSAFHMPRAVGAFRAAGFPVEAYPVDYRAPADRPGLLNGRVSDRFNLVHLGTREYAGLAAYWLTGRSASLWPAPSPSCAASPPPLAARSAAAIRGRFHPAAP